MNTTKKLIGPNLFWISIGIVPLLIFAIAIVYIFTKQQEESIHQFLNESAAHASHSVDRAIGEQVGLLQGLAASWTLDEGDFASFRAQAQRLKDAHPEWRTVIVTDAKEPIFNLRFKPDEKITPLRDPESLQRVWKTQKPYVGDLSNGFVAIRVPVIRDGKTRSTLVVPVNPEFFLDSAQSAPQRTPWGYIIAGGDGIVITASTGTPFHTGQALPPHLLLPKWSAEPQKDLIFTPPNPIKMGGWQLLLFTPESSARAPFVKARLLVYAGGLLAACLTVFLIIALGSAWTARHEAVGLHREIANRSKIEEHLRQTESSLKEAQRLAEIGSWRWDTRTDHHTWSDQVYRIYGRDPQLPPARYPEVCSYFTPESWQKLNAAIETGVQEGKTYQCDAEVVRPDGSHRWVTVRGATEQDQSGQVIVLHGTVQDITERKIVEETSQRNRQILQLFVEHAPAAIAMFDTEMRYISVSDRFIADYGLTAGREIIGKSHYEVFSEIPERWKDIHRRCLLGATERCAEDPFLRPNGKTDWIRWEIRPWLDQSGTIGGVVLFSEVVTEQVDYAAKLKASEKKFRDIFNKHAAIKLIIDPDTGNIVDANEAAEKFYGWSGEQLRSKKIQDINTLSPDQIQIEIEKVQNQQRVHFEFRHRLADGSIKDVEVYSSTIDIQGKTHIHSIIHDISAKKQAEKDQEKLREQLTQAQKMESVGQLAGGVAHDYNNMLSVIMGYAELAMEKTSAESAMHDDLQEILNAARRSSDITRQLLAFARKQTIAPEVLNLNQTVDGVLKMLRRLIGEDVDLSWLPGNGLWAVKMDPSQVDQILANLCVNGRDAIAGVGKITIETDNVTFDQAYCDDHYGFIPGQYAVLAVSDDGCGMTKETLVHIFEPFFTTKGIGEGTGLGLATVYGIVKQNRGFINVYSEPGKGTTFRLYFPRHIGKVAETAIAGQAAIPGGKGETILLVEDEQAIRRLGQRMLENLGYVVLVASTPKEAIRLAEENMGRIDVLITDVVMPEMNGRDLANQLHSLYPGMLILFMSGYTSNVIVHRGVLDDGVNFIAKPFSKKDLANKIHHMIHQNKVIPS